MLVVIEQAIGSVLSLFLIGTVGYVLATRGWFSPETKALIPRLVIFITLPPHLFVSIVGTFNSQELLQLLPGLVVPALSIVIVFCLGWLLVKIIRVPQGRVGLSLTAMVTSNTIFIGLPVNVALFGEEALPYVLLYFFANTTFFWTFGNYYLNLDGGGPAVRIWSLATLKSIVSPPLLGFFLGVVAVFLNVRPPEFIFNAAYQVGSLTMPLALIYTGITLASVKLTKVRPEPEVFLVMAGRFIISPLVVGLLAVWVGLSPLMTKVFIIQSSLPVVASAVLLAGYYKADSAYASVLVSLSTLMALVSVPLFMLIISILPLN